MSEPNVKLTGWTSCGGCAAKWGGAPLADLVVSVADGDAGGLLVGLAPFDDAAVYRLTPTTWRWSRRPTSSRRWWTTRPTSAPVAAANACSDVFAMGGRVVLALNISAFPEEPARSAVIGRDPRRRRRRGRRGRRAWWPVATPSGRTSRSSGWRSRDSCTPTASSPRAARGRVTSLVLSKPLGTGIVLAGGSDD